MSDGEDPVVVRSDEEGPKKRSAVILPPMLIASKLEHDSLNEMVERKKELKKKLEENPSPAPRKRSRALVNVEF
jgi:hypothetical protein